MDHVFHRRLSYCCLILAIGLIFLAIHRSSESSESPTVMSNMSSNDDHADGVTDGQDIVVIFDVPAGRDFQINSLQTSFTNNHLETQTLSARIHADDNGLPGDVVVDLGSQMVSSGSYTPTYTPVDANVLSGGERYWVVVSNSGPEVLWSCANEGHAPKGIFSFVDNGIYNDNTFHSQPAYRYQLEIDADPVEE
jgi:hypothetical protein